MAETDENVVAPHGRDDDGVPKAPFGYNQDGNPRKSNRGRRAGIAAPPKKSEKNVKAGARPKSRSRAQTKTQLMELVGEFTAAVAKGVDTRLRSGPASGTGMRGPSWATRSSSRRSHRTSWTASS
jgi:hypothetical protein